MTEKSGKTSKVRAHLGGDSDQTFITKTFYRDFEYNLII